MSYNCLLESLGDALMFFISLTKLNDNNDLGLFTDLCAVVESNEYYLRELTIGAAYCHDAYSMIFIKNDRDVYDKDIGLTACLVSVAGLREFVVNEGFVAHIHADYNKTENKNQFPQVPKMVGPLSQQFKELKSHANIFKFVGRVLPCIVPYKIKNQQARP